MSDDLTAVLARVLAAHPRRQGVSVEEWAQSVAARLAEVEEKWHAEQEAEAVALIPEVDLERKQFERAFDAKEKAERELAEAAKHCRILLNIIDYHRKPGGYMTEHVQVEEARAFLARRKESP